MDNDVRLCPAVEGVLFTTAHAGRLVRCLILRDALEAAFGARAEPDDWLLTFHAHRPAIERVARALRAEMPQDTLVLLRARHFEPVPHAFAH